VLSPRLEACSTALPAHYYTQEDLLAGLEGLWQAQHFNPQRLRQLHGAMGISGRHLALPKDKYAQPATFTERNREFQRVSLDLAEQVVCGVLADTGVPADEIDYLVYTTITGLAVPSLDAQLMNRVPFRPDLKRMPVFGWGCLGGAAGAARLSDLLRSQAPSRGLLLSVELCSLTLQPQDLSVANLIASGLFGDGAAAVLMSSGHMARGPRVIATRSVFFPQSEDVMGWDIGEHGFGIVLSPQVPYQAEHNLAPALSRFLAEFSLSPADIGAWVAHPGGPKVIEALEQALRLSAGALDVTRRSLTEIGNLSSASVLFILREVLQQQHEPGTYGVMLAMGPGFCAELLLLQW
jgi:alkylresorcinol/alkylpyrone synthase